MYLISSSHHYYQGLYDMEYAVMDATRLDNIPSLCFDLILDKGELAIAMLSSVIDTCTFI